MFCAAANFAVGMLPDIIDKNWQHLMQAPPAHYLVLSLLFAFPKYVPGTHGAYSIRNPHKLGHLRPGLTEEPLRCGLALADMTVCWSRYLGVSPSLPPVRPGIRERLLPCS
eukprot:SAG25_NODE_36_length_19907_cov_10.787027_12_plen_111_part_00